MISTGSMAGPRGLIKNCGGASSRLRCGAIGMESWSYGVLGKGVFPQVWIDLSSVLVARKASASIFLNFRPNRHGHWNRLRCTKYGMILQGTDSLFAWNRLGDSPDLSNPHPHDSNTPQLHPIARTAQSALSRRAPMVFSFGSISTCGRRGSRPSSPRTSWRVGFHPDRDENRPKEKTMSCAPGRRSFSWIWPECSVYRFHSKEGREYDSEDEDRW